MALRMQTSAVSADGTPFAPAGEVILQAEVTGKGNPIVDVFVRVHNDAPWRRLLSFLPTAEHFKRIADFPQMMIAVRENNAGASVSVWDKA